MKPLYSVSQVRRLEAKAIEEGVSESALMERAARGIVAALAGHFGPRLPSTKGIVVAGKGKNGGDARLAEKWLTELGCQISHSITEADWLIDGIFGIGLSRPVEGEERTQIEEINALKKTWVLSVDVPSGLSAETGFVQGVAVKANYTVTFGVLKTGLFTGVSADYTGAIELVEIGLSSEAPTARLFEETDAVANLPKRLQAGHKGSYGHVFVYAGSEETRGASILSAIGALRSGVGLVSVVGDEETLKEMRPRLLPEIMTKSEAGDGAIVIGPGFGIDDKRRIVLEKALSKTQKAVVDADAITLLSSTKMKLPPCTVLTPHPKEAARLLGREITNRYSDAQEIADKFNAVVCLKGKGTVIAAPGKTPWVVTTGDSSLSKGGSGDVLSGIIATFLNQTDDAQLATALAAYVHGRAAELLTKELGTERSALPSEVAGMLSEVYRELDRE